MPLPPDGSLEGWAPAIGDGVSLDEVIDAAFDYRGNVTLERADGGSIVCYVSNRDARPYRRVLQYFDESGEGPFDLAYANVVAIRFTGKDTAAGNSYEDYQRRKAEERAREGGAPA